MNSHGNLFNPRYCQRFDQSHRGAPTHARLQVGRAKVSHPLWCLQNAGQASTVPTLSKQAEVQMTREFVRDMTPAKIRALKAHIKQEKEAISDEDVRGRTELLGDFHVRIAELMGNPVLAQILGELISRCALITLMYQSQNAAQHSAEEHEEIVEAMAKKDADLAAQLMESHLNFVEQSLSFNKKIPTHDIALALS
jgi:DNA-binding FadR family transcriptional regulator